MITRTIPILTFFGLLSCSQPRQSENNTTDTTSIHGPVITKPESVNEYELASINRDLDSDSLLADKGDWVKFSKFLTKGIKIVEQEYGGGDCGGKFRQLVLEKDTLTIDKYDCGDYGFGNNEYITDGDSLRYMREYKMEWNRDDQGNEFNVSETIYEFSTHWTTRRTRAKSIKGWKDFRINELNFEESLLTRKDEYNKFKKELKDLKLKEKLDE